MRKQRTKRVQRTKITQALTIKEDVAIGKGVILEKGDKIKVLKEQTSNNIDDVMTDVQSVVDHFRPSSSFPTSVLDEASEYIVDLIQNKFDDNDYDDLSDDGDFSFSLEVSSDDIEDYLEDNTIDLDSDEIADWLQKDHKETYQWFDNAINSDESFDSFEDLGNKAYREALLSAMTDILAEITKSEGSDGIYTI